MNLVSQILLAIGIPTFGLIKLTSFTFSESNNTFMSLLNVSPLRTYTCHKYIGTLLILIAAVLPSIAQEYNFVIRESIPFEGTVQILGVQDMDADGNLDIVVANGQPNTRYKLWLVEREGGSFVQRFVFSTTIPS